MYSPDPGTPSGADGGRRGLSTTALLLILVCGAGTVLSFGLSSLRANDRADEPPVFDGPVRRPSATVPTPTSPVLAPVVEAQNVVDEIEENELEAELLDELGLDPTGHPAGHRADLAEGDTVEFTDARSTSWQLVVSDGQNLLTSSNPDAGEPPLSLDARLTPDDIVTDAVAIGIADTSFSISTETGATATQTLDLVALRAQSPDALTAWAESVGLPATSLGVDGADTAVVVMTQADDGSIDSFSVEVPALGLRSVYVRTSATG